MDLSALLPLISGAAPLPDKANGEALRLGCSDAAKPSLIAALSQKWRTPTLVVVSRATQAADLVEELRAWLGQEDAGRVRLYPQRDILPYERADDDAWDIRSRLDTLASMSRGEPLVLVATVEAVAQRALSPDAINEGVDQVAVGAALTPEQLLERLQSSGYEIVPLVDTPGQTAHRGGIVDFYPPLAERPLRVEFFGSKVESIREFGSVDQRSQQRVEEAGLGIASEFSPDPELARQLLSSLDLASEETEAATQIKADLEQLAAGRQPARPSFLPALLSSHGLLQHMPNGARVFLDEPGELRTTLDEYIAETSSMRLEREQRGLLPPGLPTPQARWSEIQEGLFALQTLELLRFETEEAGALRPNFTPPPAFGGRVRELAREAAEIGRSDGALVVVSQQASRIATLLREEGLGVAAGADSLERPAAGSIQAIKGSLPHGWALRGRPDLTLLTDNELFGFVKQRRAEKRQAAGKPNLLAELSAGDYVVHIEHGIGRFSGLLVRNVEGIEKEFIELAYAERDKLFVPVDQSDRVARYVGPGDIRPTLTRLGGGEWTRTRDRVRRSVAEVARELVELYAQRQVVQGHAFSADTPWQQELEASFPYVETTDQLAAISMVKADMENGRPMDRLICGDVGYGKTEVAIRAAFKAVMDGFQVAMLVPTTVLAQQHYNTFKERLASLPARVEMMSRFLNDKEQRRVAAEVADGSVDILIGTHRILQKDVSFKKLALIIIDEEQRFGVAHKERLKQMRKEVDALTLSATPIPRTLHMSLVGIRDLSNMNTPPEDRVPIRTYVTESDDQIIREAVLRELERGGQVFFVHNRVHNIELIAVHLRDLVPEAAVGMGHGQMNEEQLERTMLSFSHGELDVLVCTTIIESGLDIPTANTIIINQADRLGLAQLYQLRGRVGRGAVRAYAYLLYNKDQALSERAQKRLQAIFEATELGAGYQIAMRDLEIRGAGNILGSEQSGHMEAVGFDLYVRLLGEAVERLKALQRGEPPLEPKSSHPAASLDLPVTAYLSEIYVPDLNLRLALYQRLAQIEGEDQVAALEQEMADRFGPLPAAAKSLLWMVRLRLLANTAGVASVKTEADQMVIRLLPGLSLDRDAVQRRLPAGSSVTSHQIRLDQSLLSGDWREALVRSLNALAEKVAAVPA